MRRVLVTGASGFIGRRIVGYFRELGDCEVTVMTRAPRDIEEGYVGLRTLVVPDYSLGTMEAAVDGMVFDNLVHLAAAGVHPSERAISTLIRANVVLPADVVALGAKLKVSATVCAGTSSEYAQIYEDVCLRESDPLESVALYGATKAAGGLLALAVGHAVGTPTAVMRIFNAFGPGEGSHRLLPSLWRALNLGECVALSKGTQIRDFIHVDDVCKGLVSALDALAAGKMSSGAYNLASGRGHSVREFAETVCEAMGRPKALLNFGAIPMRPDDRGYIVADTSSLLSSAGWRSSQTLGDAIDCTIAELRRTAGDLS
jgi:nucleoside-diphosphate-sugar epimerase